ncbi:MAG: transporter [Paenibacillus sp.]|nr:transporter [Paenibacillus sp.]
MNAYSRTNTILLLAVVFGGFLIFGISENVKGPAIPLMQRDFQLTESQLGLLLALNSLGYLAACTFTSYLAGKIGIRWTGIAAFASMAVAGVLMYLSASYGSLSAAYFLLYIGNGMLEIGLAIMAARIFTKNAGTMMNLAHFFYGLSSMFAPMLAASLIGVQVGGGALGWRGMYVVMLMLSLLPILPSLLGRFPADGRREGGKRVSFKQLLRDPIAWLIVAVLSFGVVSELAVGSWLVYYVQNAYGWSVGAGSRLLSLFFLFFMLARLLLGPLTDRIGYTLSIMLFSAFSGLCSLAAIVTGEKGAIMFAIAGVGIAPIYPTVMALIAKRYAHSVDTAITFTVTLMGICCVGGNVLIGAVIDGVRNSLNSQRVGLQAGYGVIALLALLCSAVCIVLYVALRKRKELV